MGIDSACMLVNKLIQKPFSDSSKSVVAQGFAAGRCFRTFCQETLRNTPWESASPFGVIRRVMLAYLELELVFLPQYATGV